MAAGDNSVRSLEYTPTWALATVCLFMVSVSILLEHSIHLLTNWLKKHRKVALNDAVDRIKSELMLLGFMSLILAVTQVQISNICISTRLADIMLPCSKPKNTTSTTTVVEDYQVYSTVFGVVGHLLHVNGFYNNTNNSWTPHRGLDEEEKVPVNETATTDSCAEGKVPLVAQEGIQQLQIFIFVLAVMQIVYSLVTMGLGRAKMRRWKAWEKETQTTEYQVANDPNRFRFTRQTTFGRRHTTMCTDTSIFLWIKCFFRQFSNSVAKVDYLTLRHGFIAAHLSARNKDFNFQKYIQRSLEEDFKEVVSISPLMWFIVVIFMLVDVHGWNVYLWVSYVPLLIVLLTGTKLEVIVARMALQVNNQNNVIIGTPLVQPNDDLFWFGRPSFVLTLLHLTLFVNAFELAFFIWVTIQFGVKSCYHEHTVIIVTRVVLAVTVQVLCSYITLPLYALVTQMGSQFKSKALEEQIAKIIKQWHAEVRDKRRRQEQSFQSTPRTSLSAEWSLRNSPIDYSSHHRPMNNGMPTESNHLSNRGEITEEEQVVDSSRVPPRTGMLELPTVRN
ncbi:MLO-like protein 3 [Cornus florida]|uniref:MLO-like protein 3 n=1 Tax=Cornus florida TaxID=4283 RepID=UPI00289830A1|nr:MLO-like protein 3 [Cornus florida]